MRSRFRFYPYDDQRYIPLPQRRSLREAFGPPASGDQPLAFQNLDKPVLAADVFPSRAGVPPGQRAEKRVGGPGEPHLSPLHGLGIFCAYLRS